MMRLLLGSGGLSTIERREAWKTELDSFLGSIRKVVFLPYAGGDHDTYVKRMQELDLASGREIEGLHRSADPVATLKSADAIFVGGGNTFRLLYDVYRLGLKEVLEARARAGIPYIGISAGTNLAGPTIMTTNDMPIVAPPSFAALNLVPFQINPHYFAGALHYETPQGLLKYGGETRDDRLREFHEMNETPIVALWEGSILRVEGKKATLCGPGGCRLFRKGKETEDRASGTDLSELL